MLTTNNYKDIQVGPAIYRFNLNNGKVNRIAPTGRGRQVRYVASPLARVMTKAMKMGMGVGKDLKGLVGKMEGIFSPAGRAVQ
jgi:hypothetical protein